MTIIKNRRGTASQWTTANPVLAEGEIGFETDTGKHKIGNGVSAWLGLHYFVDESGLLATFASQMTTVAKAIDYTAGAQEFVEVDASAAVRTITGPAAGAAKRWGVKKINGTTATPGNKVTISYLNSAGTPTTLDLTLAAESKVFRPSGSGYRVETGDTPNAGLAAAFAFKAPPSVLMRPIIMLQSDFDETYPSSGVLKDWAATNTGTASQTVANSSRIAGGKTLTLVDADAAGLSRIKTRNELAGSVNRPEWYTIDEVSLPSGAGSFNFEIGAGATFKAIITVLSSTNKISLNASDGVGQVVATGYSGTVVNFDVSRPFRLGIWYHPRTGEARFYVFYDDGAGSTRHVFLGSRTNTAGAVLGAAAVGGAITYVQFNTNTTNTGNATAARFEAAEVRGVIHGPSTTCPHNAWDSSPNLYPTQSRFYGLHNALAQRLYGRHGGIVNMCHGGYALPDMYSGHASYSGDTREATATWANMVTGLKPKWVGIGSAINSVVNAANPTADPAGATPPDLTLLVGYKALVTSMITDSLAAGIEFVVVEEVGPVGGHVYFPSSTQTDVVTLWNTWINTLPSLYPGQVAVAHVFDKLKDPVNPTKILPIYDIGDHIHYTALGAEALADAWAEAILGR